MIFVNTIIVARVRPLNAVDMQWLLKSELSQINSGRAAVDVTTVQSFNSWPSPWFFPRLTAKSDLFIHNKRQHTTAFRKQTLKAQVFRLCARRKELWAGEKIPFPFLLHPPPPPPPLSFASRSLLSVNHNTIDFHFFFQTTMALGRILALPS